MSFLRLSACARAGRWERALGLLDDMQLKGLAPNMISYSAAISACSKGGCWERALQLLQEMRRAGHSPNVISYSAAISACDKGGQWERALALLQEMINLGLEADVVSYNAAISACTKGKQWAAALSLLEQMHKVGVAPNVITYNATIAACEKGDQWMRALMLLDEMRLTGNRPDVISYNSSIGACDRGAQGRRAVGLLQEMRRAGIEIEAISYSGAISACAKEGRLPMTMKLLNEMHSLGLQPTLPSCISVLDACKKARQWRLALVVVQQLELSSKSPSHDLYMLASDVCNAAGENAQADLFRDRAAAVLNTKINAEGGTEASNLVQTEEAEKCDACGPSKAVDSSKFSFAAVAAATPPRQLGPTSPVIWTSMPSSMTSSTITPVTWSSAVATSSRAMPPASTKSDILMADSGDALGSASEWRLTPDERDRAILVSPVGSWQNAIRNASFQAPVTESQALESSLLSNCAANAISPVTSCDQDANFYDFRVFDSKEINSTPTKSEEAFRRIDTSSQVPPTPPALMSFQPSINFESAPIALGKKTMTSAGHLSANSQNTSNVDILSNISDTSSSLVDMNSSLGGLNVDAQPFPWDPNSTGLDEYIANLVLDEQSR